MAAETEAAAVVGAGIQTSPAPHTGICAVGADNPRTEIAHLDGGRPRDLALNPDSHVLRVLGAVVMIHRVAADGASRRRKEHRARGQNDNGLDW